VVLALAVPLNLVIVGAVWHMSKTASETLQTSLHYTARSVAAAVDYELGEAVALAQALARSPALFENNLDAFEAEARRALASITDAQVMVADLGGQLLINTAQQPGQSLPVRDPVGMEAQNHAFEARSPYIGDVREGSVSQEWIINIEVPIFKDGQRFRALAVALKTQSFFRLLNAQHMPENWGACITDHKGRFVARVPDYERSVGKLTAGSFRKIRDQEGISEFLSLDGEPMVTANAHSAVSGWPVAVAVKKASIQAEAWNTVRWAAIAAGSLSFLSLLFAGVISRRITGPIAALRQNAAALLTDPASAQMPHGPPEVSDLWEAMKLSAAARDRSDKAQRESEQRLRGIFQHAGTGIAIKDLDGKFQSCNPAYASMLGYTEAELRELRCEHLMHPDDCATSLAQQKRLVAGEIPSYEIVTRYFGKEGKILWGHRHTSLLKDAGGTPTNVIVLVTNITGQKLHEEHIRLLLREVNHRSKNLFALVQAVARQTLATKPEDFIDRFVERIQALAANQDLLVKNAWKGVDLRELASSQLAHFKDLIGTRIELKGPPLLISASAAQTIGMALHELATNAGKYGALINGDGQVKIEWSLDGAGAREVIFSLSWSEQGGPPVAVPSHSGFGSKVVSNLAEKSLAAKVDLRFSTTGLSWRLSCRAGEVIEQGCSAGRTEAGCRPGPLSTRPRVLVVEDEPLAAMEIAQILDAGGFDVAGPAGGAAAALAVLKSEGCDAAVLDINLRGETSERVALELIESGTPFVTLSGYSREQRPPVFKSAPALIKPLRPELLISELRRGITQRRERAECRAAQPAQ
jgi:PAS domain S-box-containing protein